MQKLLIPKPRQLRPLLLLAVGQADSALLQDPQDKILVSLIRHPLGALIQITDIAKAGVILLYRLKHLTPLIYGRADR